MKPCDDCRFGLSVQRSGRAHDPAVHIFLQRVVRQANGMLAVTPICSSLEEIEGEIEELREGLDVVLRQAREAFAARRGPAVPS